jgi:hypothetical protein
MLKLESMPDKEGKKALPAGLGKLDYPRYSLEKALRIPRAILEQNAGKECSDRDSASYVKIGYTGPYQMELSAAIKYGLLERPAPKRVRVTELAKRILRPQNANDELKGLREAALKAPTISDVYNHYRGENLPDPSFFRNALMDTFKLPAEKVDEFSAIFFQTMKKAGLTEDMNGKVRVLDVSEPSASDIQDSPLLKKLEKEVKVEVGDSCFVVMPFAKPIGDHYRLIYETAIRKAGLTPVRADNEIFGTGKIIDQVWSGINSAKVLIAELTNRNPNVFYELGLAHALEKPVVLISSNENDVPFDLQHIRVIYYDVNDPFWGNKLLEKVAENILSAIKNPAEAIFKKPLP